LGEQIVAVLAEPDTSSAVVLEAQKLLNKASKQSRAPEDGAFDKNTVEAIKAFQIESGLKPTGVLDDAVMKILKDVANEERPKWQVTVNGKIYLLTDADHKALMNRLKEEFRPAITALRDAMIEARTLYDHMKELNKDQYIVAWCIEAVKGANLPSESLIKAAEKGVEEAEKALSGGNLRAFSVIFPKAQEQANKARTEMKTYVEDMIKGGGNIVTGLEIVKGTSFVVVGIIAAPVAASYGLGAVAAGVVAGAGTAAVETLAEEAGKGIAGESKGVGDAAMNVLLDAFIGGSIGALISGKGAEKILEKLGPKVAKLLGGKLFEKASEKAVTAWVIAYFKKNGANILEGVMKETMKTFRANAESLTVEKFIGIVAKEVATAGIFAKFGEAGNLTASSVLKQVGSKQRDAWLKELGAKASAGDVDKLFGKVFDETYKEWGGKVYDGVLGALTGAEEPAAVEKKIIDEAATNRMLIAAVTKEMEKQGKKK
jgi:Putative peptidoglycan binding domain